MRLLAEALTFDDVYLVPGHSNVLPRDVDTSTRLTCNLRLNVPILSAAMDTVTEARLAIVMAQCGGIGIIHKNMTPDQQAAEVRLVKKFEAGVIRDPLTVRPDTSIRDVMRITREHGISGVPVVSGEELVGIVTSRDMRFEKKHDDPVKNIMTRKERLVTVKEGASEDEVLALLHKHRIEKVLVVNDAFQLRGLITVKDIQKARDNPHAAKDSVERLRVEAALALRDAGADAVKVGVGPGSICTTRIVTGVGVPQITAIDLVANALKGDIPLIADGGIRYSGDVAKAIVAGASTVMLGSMFAGTEESPGEVELFQGRTYKSYRGMGSIGAMEQGSSDRYFQDASDPEKLVPEGIEGRIPYRGPLRNVIQQLVGGLRASMGYCGCATIDDMRTRPQFVRVTSAGVREAHPHDVQIVKEAPNYRLS